MPWLAPLYLITYTTPVGHSGYRMSPLLIAFHPLVVPVVLVSGRWMLTPGDHHVHHSHRRYNFELSWRRMDRLGRTYRRPGVRAHDVGVFFGGVDK
jgi:sterol desaturase/sphingolipid hydroxylase (fatty acid hydroxylase superfamily)